MVSVKSVTLGTSPTSIAATVAKRTIFITSFSSSDERVVFGSFFVVSGVIVCVIFSIVRSVIGGVSRISFAFVVAVVAATVVVSVSVSSLTVVVTVAASVPAVSKTKS